jgi:hypothetical protein
MQTFDLPSSGIFSSEASPEGSLLAGEPPTGVDPSSKIYPNLESKIPHLQLRSVYHRLFGLVFPIGLY